MLAHWLSPYPDYNLTLSPVLDLYYWPKVVLLCWKYDPLYLQHTSRNFSVSDQTTNIDTAPFAKFNVLLRAAILVFFHHHVPSSDTLAGAASISSAVSAGALDKHKPQLFKNTSVTKCHVAMRNRLYMPPGSIFNSRVQ